MQTPITVITTDTEIRAVRPRGVDPETWQRIKAATTAHLDNKVAEILAER